MRITKIKMQVPILLIWILLISPASCWASSIPKEAEEASKLVGLRYGPGLPEGYALQRAALIDAMNGKEFGITHVKKGSTQMVWFDVMTHRVSKKAHWMILDVLVLPSFTINETLEIGQCFLNGVIDSEIVAIVEEERDQEFLSKIHRAWRANRGTGKFESIPPIGIKCTNENYGMD